MVGFKLYYTIFAGKEKENMRPFGELRAISVIELTFYL